LEDVVMRVFGPSLALILMAHPAAAIDCRSANSETEKAICSDPKAVSADQALGKAYVELRKSLPEQEAAGLRHAQLEWIHDRDSACAAASAVKPLSACLAEKSSERQRFLEGRPRAGDASISLFKPLFVFRPARDGVASLSIQAIKLTGEGEWQSRLNRKIDKAIKDAMADAETGQDNPGNKENYFVELGIDVAYASPRLISVQFEFSSFVGQAHPNYGNTNINIDPASGRELTFKDLLDEASARPVFEFCRSEVAKQKKARSDDPDHWKDDVGLQETAEGTKDFSSWRFNASSVDVDYGAYGFGGYGQCMCSCTIPYSMLRPIAKREFPLP
jgi:uncharacterized protein YecT (DUF1311 family)